MEEKTPVFFNEFDKNERFQEKILTKTCNFEKKP